MANTVWAAMSRRVDPAWREVPAIRPGEPPSPAHIPRCIWLDGMLVKACRVLRARLEPLGYRIVCKSRLPDDIIAALASASGCAIVTSDKGFARKRLTRGYNTIYIDARLASRKSARDLATLIIKTVARTSTTKQCYSSLSIPHS